MPQRPEIAAYYFPNYHIDPRNEKQHGPGWTEWELVKAATPRFPDHQQPKVPAWGYEDESDPKVMARKIATAADHGLDAFIFDWYWFDDGPFLEGGLERGFLPAANADRLRFAIMWANHDWQDIHPAKPRLYPDLYRGAVTPATFDAICDHWIRTYFRHPSYWLIDGCPYVSIYELYRLITGLGGIDATREAIARLRAKVRAAGFPDVHLNGVVWGIQILPSERSIADPAAMAMALGLSSVTSYCWVHHVQLTSFPRTLYTEVAARAAQTWPDLARGFPVPYHPNVSMGWDSSPRTIQSDRYTNAGYPYMPILEGNTPQAFQRALEAARIFLQSSTQPILTLNAWNEWTEGSYLEPDLIHGMQYLQAIKAVFPR